MTDLEQREGCLSGILPPSVVGFLRRLLADSEKAAPELPKVMIDRYFVSDAECALFHTLRKVVADRAHILAQVSLQQLFYFPAARSEAQKSARGHWQNKVRAKSIDFLLCCPKTMKPLVAIEYDDRTHEKDARKTRDAEVERLFAAASLPLLRINCGRGDDVLSLQKALLPHLAKPTS
jgi:hypothetical protein